MDNMTILEQYQAIGTIEECREAMDKQRKMEPKITNVDRNTVYMKCQSCKLTTVLYRGMEPDFCPKCGQAILWKDEINIEPRKPTDRGGYYCMPLKKNVQKGHDD